MKELVEYIAKALVANPDQVEVTEINERTTTIIELSVAESDKGRIIGREGCVVNAVRTLIKVPAARQGKRVTLEIV